MFLGHWTAFTRQMHQQQASEKLRQAVSGASYARNLSDVYMMNDNECLVEYHSNTVATADTMRVVAETIRADLSDITGINFTVVNMLGSMAGIDITFHAALQDILDIVITPPEVVPANFAVGVNMNGGLLLHAGTIAAMSAATTGILSFWHKAPSDGSYNYFYVVTNGSGNLQAYHDETSTYINFGGSPSTRFNHAGAGNHLDDLWHHYLFSWNLGGGGSARVAVDGTLLSAMTKINGGGGITSLNASAAVNWALCRATGVYAEIYMAVGATLDLTNADNIALFIADGQPVNLDDAITATDLPAPDIYLSQRSEDDVTEFTTNKGSAGNFTVSGGTGLTVEDAGSISV